MKRLALTASLFIALGAVFGTLSAAPVSAQESGIDTFQTPSGNTQCLYDRSQKALRCTVLNSTAKLTPKPADCDLDWGSDVEINATGRPGHVCAGDTIQGHYRTVKYGVTWRNGPFSCTPATTGLTCRNLSKHGFTISKAKQRFF